MNVTSKVLCIKFEINELCNYDWQFKLVENDFVFLISLSFDFLSSVTTGGRPQLI